MKLPCCDLPCHNEHVTSTYRHIWCSTCGAKWRFACDAGQWVRVRGPFAFPLCCANMDDDVVEDPRRHMFECDCSSCGAHWEARADAWERLPMRNPWREVKGSDKRLVTYSVMVPDVPMPDGYGGHDVADAGTIRKAAANVSSLPSDGKLSVVESYVTDEPQCVNGQDVPAGTWLMTCHVDDDDLWRRIKSGEIDRVSVDWDPRERTMRGYQPKPPKGGTAAVKPPPGWVPNPGGSAVVPSDWSPKLDGARWQATSRVLDGVHFTCHCGKLHEADGKYHLCDCGAELYPMVDSMGYMVVVHPKLDQATADELNEFFEQSEDKATSRVQVIEADPPKGLLLVGSGKPEFVSLKERMQRAADAVDRAVKNLAESSLPRLSVKMPAGMGSTSDVKTRSDAVADLADASEWLDSAMERANSKQQPTRSRHQARLERRYSKRPLPSDKPEKRRRRWFWPAVITLLTLISGVAGALTIYDRWPESMPKYAVMDTVPELATTWCDPCDIAAPECWVRVRGLDYVHASPNPACAGKETP